MIGLEGSRRSACRWDVLRTSPAPMGVGDTVAMLLVVEEARWEVVSVAIGWQLGYKLAKSKKKYYTPVEPMILSEAIYNKMLVHTARRGTWVVVDRY